MYEFSKHIGFNLHWAKKCNLGGKFEINDDIAKLSWEDYKAFNSGWGRMISARSGGCDKDSVKMIIDETMFYLQELRKKVDIKLGISSPNQTSSTTLPKKAPQGKVSKIDYAENKCSEIGYNKGTEKFADCVMKLIDD